MDYARFSFVLFWAWRVYGYMRKNVDRRIDGSCFSLVFAGTARDILIFFCSWISTVCKKSDFTWINAVMLSDLYFNKAKRH